MSATLVQAPVQKLEKKPVKFSNLLLGASLNMFEVTTLGQPLEVVKTTMAANRSDTFAGAMSRIWSRGGILGCKHAFPRQACADKLLTPLPLQITKVSFPGLGLKPRPRALCFSSLPPRANTTPKPLAHPTLAQASSVAWPAVLLKHTLRWASAPA